MKIVGQLTAVILTLIFQLFLAKWVSQLGFSAYKDYVGTVRPDLSYGLSVEFESYVYLSICFILLIVMNWVKKADMIYLLFFIGYIVFTLFCAKDFVAGYSHPYRGMLVLISCATGMFIPLIILQQIVLFFLRRFPGSEFLKALPFGKNSDNRDIVH